MFLGAQNPAWLVGWEAMEISPSVFFFSFFFAHDHLSFLFLNSVSVMGKFGT
jgi:hypothetical protein